MNTKRLGYTDNIKYLGFTFSSDKKDDNDMLRQMRILNTKSNRLLRLEHLIHCCSTDVFRSYCACFYCPCLWILPNVPKLAFPACISTQKLSNLEA